MGLLTKLLLLRELLGEDEKTKKAEADAKAAAERAREARRQEAERRAKDFQENIVRPIDEAGNYVDKKIDKFAETTDTLLNNTADETKTLWVRIRSGILLLLGSSAVAAGVNYLFKGTTNTEVTPSPPPTKEELTAKAEAQKEKQLNAATMQAGGAVGLIHAEYGEDGKRIGYDLSSRKFVQDFTIRDDGTWSGNAKRNNNELFSHNFESITPKMVIALFEKEGNRNPVILEEISSQLSNNKGELSYYYNHNSEVKEFLESIGITKAVKIPLDVANEARKNITIELMEVTLNRGLMEKTNTTDIAYSTYEKSYNTSYLKYIQMRKNKPDIEPFKKEQLAAERKELENLRGTVYSEGEWSIIVKHYNTVKKHLEKEVSRLNNSTGAVDPYSPDLKVGDFMPVQGLAANSGHKWDSKIPNAFPAASTMEERLKKTAHLLTDKVKPLPS